MPHISYNANKWRCAHTLCGHTHEAQRRSHTRISTRKPRCGRRREVASNPFTMDVVFFDLLHHFKATIASRGLYIAELRLVADASVKTQVVFQNTAPASPAQSAYSAVDEALGNSPPQDPLEQPSPIVRSPQPMEPMLSSPLPISDPPPLALGVAALALNPQTAPQPITHDEQLPQSQQIFRTQMVLPPPPPPPDALSQAMSQTLSDTHTPSLPHCQAMSQPPHALSQSLISNPPRKRGGGGAHVCTECGATFAYNSKLTRHIDHVHRRVRGKDCALCSKSFYYNSDLRKHLQLVHQRDRPHKCAQCDQCFQVKSQLVRHEIERHEFTFHSYPFLPPSPTPSPQMLAP